MKKINAAILSILFVVGSSIRSEVPLDMAGILDCSGKIHMPAEVDAQNLKMLCHGAISTDANTSKNSIEKLRAKGPKGLQALLNEYAGVLNPSAGNLTAESKDTLARV